MPFDFHNSIEYKKKQSAITKEKWRKGVFDFRYKKEKRICAREGCNHTFEVIPSNPKIYCCNNCSAKVNNKKRGALSENTKKKIRDALKGRPNPYKGIKKVPMVEVICANPKCKKVFLQDRWQKRKFCSKKCAIEVIGGRPTSPKAARGKAGIRKDINETIYFYSRWEANFARLCNHLDIEWVHQPKTFDLGSQKYTPDFYLPNYDLYIEVKNFLWKYSKIRDEKFRKFYPNIELTLLLKKDYLVLQSRYSHLIKYWEYKNSPFPYNISDGKLISSKL
jgi:hypothetical protein